MRERTFVHQPDAIGEPIKHQRTHISSSLQLEISLFFSTVMIGSAEHHRIGEAGTHHLVHQGTVLSHRIGMGRHAHHHHLWMMFQARQVFLCWSAIRHHKEFEGCLHHAEQRNGIVGEDGEAVGLCLIAVEIHDILHLWLPLFHLASIAHIEEIGHGVALQGYGPVSVRGDDHRTIVATDVHHGIGGATLWMQVVELRTNRTRYHGMPLASGDIVHQMARHGNLGFGLLAQRHTDGVSYAIGKQGTNAHSTLDAPVFTLASFGNAQMQRIVHPLLVHGGHQQAHRLHHHHRVACLDRDDHIAELLFSANAQKLHTALHDTLGCVAIARHDAVRE